MLWLKPVKVELPRSRLARELLIRKANLSALEVKLLRAEKEENNEAELQRGLLQGLLPDCGSFVRHRGEERRGQYV